MLLPSIIVKNLLHRPTRTALTLAGIAIAVGALVALRCVASGFMRSWERLYDSRGTDLLVTRVLSHNLMPELFDESLRGAIEPLPGVEEVAAVYDEMMGIEELPMAFVFGWERASFLWDHLTLLEGRWPGGPDANEVALGELAAELLEKSPGDTLFLEVEPFVVTGTFQSGAFLENSAVLLDKERLQRLVGNPGKARFFNIRLTPGLAEADRAALADRIGQALPGFKAYRPGDVARHSNLMQMARTTSWVTSIIALVVGTVGVMNTMLMSVFERVREIGILLAVGWRRSRVVGMILGESLVLSVIGGFLGIGVGAGLVQALRIIPRFHGKVEGDLTPDLALVALAIAVALGLLGGWYPAMRASRMEAVEALRHE